MINQILGTLSELEGTELHRNVDFNFLISGALILIVYTPGGRHYHVKISDRFDLENEYQGTRRAFEALPCNVAEPVALKLIEGKQVLICRGIKHLPLTAAKLTRHDSFIAEQLLRLFECSITHFSTSVHVSPSLAQIVESNIFPATVHVPMQLVTYFEDCRRLVESRPAIFQHGDFAVNNIGRTETSLIYFDWEDYSKISAPGFDACLLVASTLGFEEHRIRKFFEQKRKSALGDVTTWIGASLGITDREFLALFPYYLSLNAILKLEYGIKIVEKNLQLATALLP